jgi:hypothetical protein
MVIISGGRSSRGGATVVNGCIIYGPSTKRTTFSWLRWIVVTSLLLYLHGTNPENFSSTNPKYLHPKQRAKLKQAPKSRSQVTLERFMSWGNEIKSWTQIPFSKSSTLSSHERRRTTNFWFFHVQENSSKGVVVAIGGFDLHCNYSDEEYPLIGISICQNVIQQYMTHRKPLMYNPNDYAYTSHRIFAFILIVSSLYSFCYTSPIIIQTGYTILDSVATFIFDDTDQSSLLSLIYRLLSLNLLIYPVLQAMEITVKQQSPDSLFVLSTTNQSINYTFSLLIWLVLAIVMNAASKSWTGRFALQFHALAAVGMGYYARYQASGMAPIFDWMLEPEEVDEAWTFITWTIVLILAVRGSITTAVFWCFAHCAGQILYQYQYDHLVLIATARSLANWIHSVGNSVQELLFGKPYHHPKNKKVY